MPNHLNKHAFGWAFGVMEAVFVLLSWILGTSAGSAELVDFISSFYIGFDTSLGGLLIGLGEALVIGFLAGYLVAWLYNMKIDKLTEQGGNGKKGEVHHYTCDECGTKFETHVLIDKDVPKLCQNCK